MFELTTGAAGWACGLLFVAALLLLGYTLWTFTVSGPEDTGGAPPPVPRQRALQPALQPVRTGSDSLLRR